VKENITLFKFSVQENKFQTIRNVINYNTDDMFTFCATQCSWYRFSFSEFF